MSDRKSEFTAMIIAAIQAFLAHPLRKNAGVVVLAVDPCDHPPGVHCPGFEVSVATSLAERAALAALDKARSTIAASMPNPNAVPRPLGVAGDVVAAMQRVIDMVPGAPPERKKLIAETALGSAIGLADACGVNVEELLAHLRGHAAAPRSTQPGGSA